MITKRKQLLVYIIGSIVFLSIPIINSNNYHNPGIFDFSNMAKQDIVRYTMLLAFFYFNYFYLIPRLYFTKKYLIYFLSLIAIMLLIAYLPAMIFENTAPVFPQGAVNPLPNGHLGPPPGNFFFRRIDHNLFLFMAVAFFSLLLGVSNRWKKTEKEKLNAELLYLKAQINPHFLFNTLNSIYSLSLQKSDSTPEAIQKLSAMMRYVLTEANNNFVPLQKEIDYIKNYIDLQQLRFGNEVKLNYSIWGDSTNKTIAPLILISFIENAFKYGLNAAEDTNIKIVINMYESRLEMLVINNKVTVLVNDENRSGIGIGNTRSRLELVYPYAHELTISETDKQFTVRISIDMV